VDKCKPLFLGKSDSDRHRRILTADLRFRADFHLQAGLHLFPFPLNLSSTELTLSLPAQLELTLSPI